MTWLSSVMLLASVGLAAGAVWQTRWSSRLKQLLSWGLCLRVVGSVAYFALATSVYGGGDYLLYYARGLDYAEATWAGDFSIYVGDGSATDRWWGTQFVFSVTGLLLSLIGPTMLGGFLVFSLLAFAGLMAFALAFHRALPGRPVADYVRWIVLFPSLWFWPSTIGKEALVLLGLGLCIAGYVGISERIRWTLLLIGLALITAVRPQVAMVALVAMLISQWASRIGQWTFGSIVQGVLIILVAIAGLSVTSNQLGLDGFDPVEVMGYMEGRAQTAALGQSAISGAAVGWSGIPLALATSLFRPFPWEVSGLPSLLSSVEIGLLWSMLLWRPRTLIQALRNWRACTLTRVALLFILLYSASLGMVVVNLGIIARQRVFIFPFLFVLIEALPAVRTASQQVPRLTLWGPSRISETA